MRESTPNIFCMLNYWNRNLRLNYRTVQYLLLGCRFQVCGWYICCLRRCQPLLSPSYATVMSLSKLDCENSWVLLMQAIDIFFTCYIQVSGNLKGSIPQNVTTQFPFHVLSSLSCHCGRGPTCKKEIPPLGMDGWMDGCMSCLVSIIP